MMCSIIYSSDELSKSTGSEIIVCVGIGFFSYMILL